jgi:hypothetical protein
MNRLASPCSTRIPLFNARRSTASAALPPVAIAQAARALIARVFRRRWRHPLQGECEYPI